MKDLEKILFGIVLYNPDLNRLHENISSCLKQADKILLVDNASKNINEIEANYEKNEKIILIKNDKNKGIATALNQILQFAYENKYKWFLTLDQDSVLQQDCVNKMMLKLSESNIGIICPKSIDINIDMEYDDKNCERIYDAKQLMTSGSLINTIAAKKIGGFDDKLFIDYVDVDFNERMLRNKYKIIRVNEAILNHELGNAELHIFLGHKIFVDNHNPLRRFYITRNRLYYKRKYYGLSGYLKERLHILLTVVKIVLYENEKLKKIKAIIKGIHEYKKLWRAEKNE